MRRRFFICDVFTGTRFGGNPLAVLPEAEGIEDEQMQRVAAEFGFSETTFVLPPRGEGTRRVRIFTPTQEVPFAGHPNIGTAFVLAVSGELGAIEGATTVVFEEEAGSVPVTIEPGADGRIRCALRAPERLSVGPPVDAAAVVSAVGLDQGDLATAVHAPCVASVGLPFVFAELADRETLAGARPVVDRFEALAALGVAPDVFLYVRGAGGEGADDGFDLHGRMFAPLDGVAEDPATGSACCALAGLLAHLDARPDAELRWRVAQGVDMGRPSALEATARKSGGEVVETGVAGTSVLVAEGEIELG